MHVRVGRGSRHRGGPSCLHPRPSPLGVQTGGHKDERLRIAWTAPDVLQVTIPNFLYLKLLMRQFDGVRVDLRFDPDDPAERAAWLREHGMSPDSGP